jgi:hypothetical protein
VVNFRVIQIACGEEHSAVLMESGDIYTFGDNSKGQVTNEYCREDKRFEGFHSVFSLFTLSVGISNRINILVFPDFSGFLIRPCSADRFGLVTSYGFNLSRSRFLLLEISLSYLISRSFVFLGIS